MLCPQKIKEEVTSPKTTKRLRESPAQEPDEPEKVTPKRPKTQVRASISYHILYFCNENFSKAAVGEILCSGDGNVL